MLKDKTCNAVIMLAALLFCVTGTSAQERRRAGILPSAMKTNLLYDAATTVSLGLEWRMAPKWSLDISGGYNNWEFNGSKQWKNFFAQPELRYWLCETWDGHFFAIHAFGGGYNMGGIKGLPDFLGTKFSDLENRRYQGWFVGAGIAYGYDWMLSRHWNIEAEVGIGWDYTRYDRFRCYGCGKKTDEDKPHNYFGPTKLAVNVVYLF